MIIVTTKTATIFINDKDVIKIDYLREKSEVMVFYRGMEKTDLIENVANIRYITDVTPCDASDQNPDTIRENNILTLENAKLDSRSQHYRFQYLKAFSALHDILDICCTKKYNHKAAREMINDIVEKRFVELNNYTEKAKREGYL